MGFYSSDNEAMQKKHVDSFMVGRKRLVISEQDGKNSKKPIINAQSAGDTSCNANRFNYNTADSNYLISSVSGASIWLKPTNNTIRSNLLDKSTLLIYSDGELVAQSHSESSATAGYLLYLFNGGVTLFSGVPYTFVVLDDDGNSYGSQNFDVGSGATAASCPYFSVRSGELFCAPKNGYNQIAYIDGYDGGDIEYPLWYIGDYEDLAVRSVDVGDICVTAGLDINDANNAFTRGFFGIKRLSTNNDYAIYSTRFDGGYESPTLITTTDDGINYLERQGGTSTIDSDGCYEYSVTVLRDTPELTSPNESGEPLTHLRVKFLRGSEQFGSLGGYSCLRVYVEWVDCSKALFDDVI